MSAAPEARVETLFEDASVLAVHKPAGVTVIPAREAGPGAPPSLRELLEAQRGERLWVVHRLDRETSGALLFARTAAAHRELSLAFERRRAHKTYLALAQGPLPAHRGTIDAPLHPARKGKMRPARAGEDGALACETEYVTRLRYALPPGALAPELSLCELRPRTGRQHQLRVHLRYVGAPLLVDAQYGSRERLDAGALGPGSPALARTPLHAARLVVPHPHERRELTVSAPVPDDLAALLAWLAPYARGAEEPAREPQS